MVSNATQAAAFGNASHNRKAQLNNGVSIVYLTGVHQQSLHALEDQVEVSRNPGRAASTISPMLPTLPTLQSLFGTSAEG